MGELRLLPPLPRVELRERLRPRLAELGASLRIVAEDLLGAGTRIDWVALDDAGRPVLVLIAEHGRELEAVAAAVAQRAWVEARLADWVQLAPDLGLRPEAGVGVVLVGAAFDATARAAAAALGPEAVALWTARCVANGTGTDVLLEAADAAPTVPRPSGGMEPRLASSFRSSLTDAQLGLTADERREFEGS